MRVVLELEPAGPVRGTIVGPDEERRAFYGWLELAAALEHVRPPQDALPALDQTTLLEELPLSPEASRG